MSVSKGIALVTGAAQGIGKSIATRLARDGFDVALKDLPTKSEKLQQVAHEIRQQGRRSVISVGDVSLEADVKRSIDTAMVANAGIIITKPISNTTVEEWDRVLNINARGVFLCYKLAAEQMIKQGRGGRIIGASSATGKRGDPAVAAYSASKFAIRGLTQCAALEYGSYGITVNAYAPGKLELLRKPCRALTAYQRIGENRGRRVTLPVPGVPFLIWDTSATSLPPEDFDVAFQRYVAQAALQKCGETSDIAGLVAYLASKEAHYITGQTINIDAGSNFD
ncbi:hypothetical protein Moror_10939 [Moniliophthora roreri MCA 2997]|uniref:Acetoin reductase family protein n=1 Tax=Moniliophthora roreri (strain MCA 2997) TaxID=1381753 RepID=V2WYP9_MONRO|nr:hypothetical protein Moror_10939 [Moniliophthora roreri MCA 2997]